MSNACPPWSAHGVRPEGGARALKRLVVGRNGALQGECARLPHERRGARAHVWSVLRKPQLATSLGRADRIQQLLLRGFIEELRAAEPHELARCTFGARRGARALHGRARLHDGDATTHAVHRMDLR